MRSTFSDVELGDGLREMAENTDAARDAAPDGCLHSPRRFALVEGQGPGSGRTGRAGDR